MPIAKNIPSHLFVIIMMETAPRERDWENNRPEMTNISVW